jgi:hypothetical protein
MTISYQFVDVDADGASEIHAQAMALVALHQAIVLDVLAAGGFWGGPGVEGGSPPWRTPTARPDPAGPDRTDHHPNAERGCSAPTASVGHCPHHHPWVITRTKTQRRKPKRRKPNSEESQ